MVWPPNIPRGFPLTIVNRGYVARIAGRPRWICGKLPPKEALAIYHRKAAALTAGNVPLVEVKAVSGVVTLEYILKRWVIDRREDVRQGRLSISIWTQYQLSGKRINEIAGHYVADDLAPDHVRAIFDYLHDNHTADIARRSIGHLRTACQYAADMGWCRPVRLGRQIAKLAAAPKDRMKWKLNTADEVQRIFVEVDRLIAGADGRSLPSMEQFKAMLLLALNGGYGAKELADLPRDVVDLDNARIDFSRGKTGATHIVPLWSETVDALRPVIARRRSDALVFRTREGNPWCMSDPKLRNGKIVGKRITDRVNEVYKNVVAPMGLRIKGQGFYKFKHLHCTIADMAGDTQATFSLAGHLLPGAKSAYVKVGEDRLRKVVEFIHDHLFTQKDSQNTSPGPRPRRASTSSATPSNQPQGTADAGPAARAGSRPRRP